MAQHARFDVVTRVNYHGAVSPDGEHLAYYSLQGIRVAPITRRRGPVIAAPEPSACATLVWSPNSERLAFVAADGVYVWNRVSESVVRLAGFSGSGSYRCAIAFDEVNRLLWVGRTERTYAIFRESEGEPTLVQTTSVSHFGFGPTETSPRLSSRRLPFVYAWSHAAERSARIRAGERILERIHLTTGHRDVIRTGDDFLVPENPVGPSGRICIERAERQRVFCMGPDRDQWTELPLPDGATALQVESRFHRSPFSPSGRYLLLHALRGRHYDLAIHDFQRGQTRRVHERAYIDRDWQSDDLLLLSEPLDRERPGLVRLDLRTGRQRALVRPGVELVRPIFVPRRDDLFFIGRERESTRDLVRARVP